MENTIRCLFCGTKTYLVFKDLKSGHQGKRIVLEGAPMHYCPNCSDGFISLEAISAMKHVKKLPLDNEVNIFNYSIVSKKAKVG